jgi:hypothetical protein
MCSSEGLGNVARMIFLGNCEVIITIIKKIIPHTTALLCYDCRNEMFFPFVGMSVPAYLSVFGNETKISTSTCKITDPRGMWGIKSYFTSVVQEPQVIFLKNVSSVSGNAEAMKWSVVFV